jgi:D-xylose transport system ATP-binding protein
MSAAHIEMQGIIKDFPGVRALDNVTFSVNKGEVHALVGENGAGKSTLIKILSGLYAHGTYEGRIRINGQECRFRGIRDAEHAGVGVIYQELSLIKELAVGENIFIGREPTTMGVISWNKVYARTRDLLQDLGLDVNSRARVKYLGTGQQQLVEIAKALSLDANILILDEPTAALTESEVETLMRIIRSLTARGVSCIYISHKLNEVFDIADRITVLRDGQTINTYDKNAVDEKQIISDMVGRELTDMYPKQSADEGGVALKVEGLTAYDPEIETRKVLDNVCFEARAGQVLGIAGLMGAGRSELLNSIFGAWSGKVEGRVLLNGKPVSIKSPQDAIRSGMGLVTEDRKRYGLVLEASVAHNITLAGLDKVCGAMSIINTHLEQKICGEQIESLRIKTPTAETVVNTLSGGNQQKVVLAKCLLTEPRVLFLDEPTRGIDVGAKTEIYQIMNQLAASGVAIVMVSSELPEVLGMSDRILVMREGRIAGALHRSDATQEKIMSLATGAAG